MADVHDGVPRDGFAVPLRLHTMLLALAGRLDDTALSESRELVARSHLDEAAELAVGALIAGRIMVRPAEQRELALVLEMSRSDATLADHLTVGDSGPGHAHRFTSDNEPERGVAEALERTLQVLPDLRSVHAVWRNTPAGSVPGPLPQRVVLIEIGPEAHPPAVAFRVDDALRRAGIRAVVEVTGPGAERTDYHEAALGSATPVWLASTQASESGATAPDTISDSPRARRAGGRSRGRARAESERSPAHAAPEATEPDRGAPLDIPQARDGAPWPDPRPASGDDSAVADSPDLPGSAAGSTATDFPEPATESLSGSVSERPAAEPAPSHEHGHDGPDARARPDQTSEQQLASAVESAAEVLAEFEDTAARTSEMSPEDVARLRAAIGEDSERGRAIAGLTNRAEGGVAPELDLDDPQLSERDRELLRELHAELAERERAEASRARTNGAQHRWSD